MNRRKYFSHPCAIKCANSSVLHNTIRCSENGRAVKGVLHSLSYNYITLYHKWRAQKFNLRAQNQYLFDSNLFS